MSVSCGVMDRPIPANMQYCTWSGKLVSMHQIESGIGLEDKKKEKDRGDRGYIAYDSYCCNMLYRII